MVRIPGTDFHYASYVAEPNTRWEYWFVLNYDQVVPDPLNPRRRQTTGWNPGGSSFPVEASELAMLGLLSASTAHELRNVLTPVLSYAQLARSKRSDSALVEKALERIVTGLKAAATILGGTLDRAEPDREHRGHHEAEVGDAAREVVAMLPRHPSHEGIDVIVEIDRGLRAAIDPVALRQVLLNLFLNAIAAMKSVGATSGVRHRLVIRGRRRAGPLPVSLEVSDTGPGIPADLAERLFEPFATAAAVSGPANGRTTGSAHGAGLGLSICRRLVDAAGGTIGHDSTAKPRRRQH